MTNYYNPTKNFATPTANRPSTQGTAVRKPSENHYNFYVKLCTERRVTPKVIDEFSAQALYDEVARIKELPFPATQPQIEKIFNLLEEINSIKPTYKMPPQAFYDKLTAEKASLQITKLIELRKTMNDIAPASDEQVNKIVGWFVCPDIPWEDYKVSNKIYLEKLTSYSTGETERTVGANELWEGWSYKPMVLSGNKEITLDERAWRYKTLDELKQTVKRSFTQQQAYDFIGKYGSVFYEWQQTRITKYQMQEYRRLEEKMYTLQTLKQVLQAVDENGELLELETSTSRERRNYKEGYEPLTDEQLRTMSKEQATQMIYKMEWELRQRELTKFGEGIHGNDQQLFHDKMVQFDEIYSQNGKGAKDQLTGKAREYRAMTDFVHRLATVVGYRDDELLAMMKEHHTDFQSDELKNAIKSYMWVSLDKSNEEKLTQSVARLYAFTEESDVLTQIVDELKEELNHQDTDGELELETII